MDRHEVQEERKRLGGLIQEARKAFEELRKKCKHPKYEILNYKRDGIHLGSLQRVCIDCLALIEEASEEEVRKYNEDNPERGPELHGCFIA